jgi:hypothetical protein
MSYNSDLSQWRCSLSQELQRKRLNNLSSHRLFHSRADFQPSRQPNHNPPWRMPTHSRWHVVCAILRLYQSLGTISSILKNSVPRAFVPPDPRSSQICKSLVVVQCLGFFFLFSSDHSFSTSDKGKDRNTRPRHKTGLKTKYSTYQNITHIRTAQSNEQPKEPTFIAERLNTHSKSNQSGQWGDW